MQPQNVATHDARECVSTLRQKAGLNIQGELMRSLIETALKMLLVAAAILTLSECVNAAGWGTLKGRFLVDGTPPTPATVNASKDAFCSSVHPTDETVIVGDGGALANAVVYLRAPRGKTVEVAEEYKASAAEPITLDNKGCSFHPHIALVRTGQPFIVKNSDPTGHNTNAKLQKNGAFNVLIAEGQENKMTFSKSEALPMPVDCNIHEFMHGYILVLDHPYMAASGADGTFEIKNIPAGKHEFQLWHEKKGNLRDLKFTGGGTSKQGRSELTIADGQTLDLGDVKVPTSLLQ